MICIIFKQNELCFVKKKDKMIDSTLSKIYYHYDLPLRGRNITQTNHDLLYHYIIENLQLSKHYAIKRPMFERLICLFYHSMDKNVKELFRKVTKMRIKSPEGLKIMVYIFLIQYYKKIIDCEDNKYVLKDMKNFGRCPTENSLKHFT